MKQCDFHELGQFTPYSMELCYFFSWSTTISNIAASICKPKILWNSAIFLNFFVPLFPGTKIHNIVKVVQESSRDAKLREREERHLLRGILLLSYLLQKSCYSSDVPGLLGFYCLHQQYWGGVWCLHICRHIVEFDSHSMHALVLTLTYLKFNDSTALQHLKR